MTHHESDTGLPIPDPPVFASPADERRHRKQRLTAALRLFGKYGYGEGISGHISVRDPEHLDRFWVNPLGLSFNRLRVADLICVDATGAVVEGHHRLNTSAFVVHAPIHAQRPDVTAAAHGHTVHSRALGSLNQLLIPLDQESAAFYQQQVLYEDYEGPSVTLTQGRDMAHKLGDKRVLVLKHHGLVTVGASLEEAVHWLFTYETCARVQLLASAAGTPQPFTHEQALAAAEGFGAPELARFSFELLWEEITHEHPDLLDE